MCYVLVIISYAQLFAFSNNNENTINCACKMLAHSEKKKQKIATISWRSFMITYGVHSLFRFVGALVFFSAAAAAYCQTVAICNFLFNIFIDSFHFSWLTTHFHAFTFVSVEEKKLVYLHLGWYISRLNDTRLICVAIGCRTVFCFSQVSNWFLIGRVQTLAIWKSVCS